MVVICCKMGEYERCVKLANFVYFRITHTKISKFGDPPPPALVVTSSIGNRPISSNTCMQQIQQILALILQSFIDNFLSFICYYALCELKLRAPITCTENKGVAREGTREDEPPSYFYNKFKVVGTNIRYVAFRLSIYLP